jgi:hypothetical protein
LLGGSNGQHGVGVWGSPTPTLDPPLLEGPQNPRVGTELESTLWFIREYMLSTSLILQRSFKVQAHLL